MVRYDGCPCARKGKVGRGDREGRKNQEGIKRGDLEAAVPIVSAEDALVYKGALASLVTAVARGVVEAHADTSMLCE
jgi:hypothetical protein